MEISDYIDKFKEFIELNYLKDLHRQVSKGKKSLVFDVGELIRFDPDLVEQLLNNPDDFIKAAELAVAQFDIGDLHARFRNFPASEKVAIKDIRSEHLGRFITIDGIVRQSSDVRPQVVSAKFECPSCGNNISILQIDTKFKEPTRCSCSRRGKFRLLSKDLVDAQRLIIEESPDSLLGGEQPKRLNVFLKEDLVEPVMEKKTTPGSLVRVSGILKDIPVFLKTGAQSTRFDLIMEVNFIEPVEETFEDIEINKEDEERILKLAKDQKIYSKLVNSIAPSIYGHDEIKEALALMLMGGVKKTRMDGTKVKGDIHVLLVGDPGAAKSTFLLYIAYAAPKARYIAGKGASAAGLCIAPDSLIPTNPGGIHRIKDLVELKFENNSLLYTKGIFYSNGSKDDKKIFTLDKNLRIVPKTIDKFWKITPPEQMVRLITSYGKEILVTPNTKLLTIVNGNIDWKEAELLNEEDYLAGCRSFKFENTNRILLLTLIKSNPIVYGVKKDIKNMVRRLCKLENLSVRDLAKKLKINENKFYHHWINEEARGNIRLRDLLKLVDYSSYDLRRVAKNVKYLSLRRGHKIKVPAYLNEDFMYVAGLIAGDGDIYANNGHYVIRFSNNSRELQQRFIDNVNKLFSVRCRLSSKRSDKRAESWRFCSRIVVEILNELGVVNSPKSHRIDMKDILLTLPNNLLKSFLSGYFDADGSVADRKNKGGSYIEVNSASKNFIRKLQLVLLRFGIQSKLRIRPPPKQGMKKNNLVINSKNNRHIIKISGRKYLELFRDSIGFGSMEKRRKLDGVLNSISDYHTNIDVIPGIERIIKRIVRNNNLTSRQVFGYKTSTYFGGKFRLSIDNLKKITNKLNGMINKDDTDLHELNLMANSDILWEKIVTKETVYDHGYDFVYDLTVNNSHNFVVDGVFVHNTATVVKDDFLRGWALEAGALVLANKGFAVLDELDKIDPEDTAALHEAMAQQQISIAKANVQATLKAETTVLAAANPKFGRFDPYKPIAGQINMPPSLINRFDLIFPIRDMPNKETDAKIASHVLNLQVNPNVGEPEIPRDLLKKYISYVRQKVHPNLDSSAMEEIKNFYVTLRNVGSFGEEQAIRPIPISARQLESLVRLAEASARIRLSDKANRSDARRAIRVLKYCLQQVGIDPETGQIDIDRISTGISASQRNKIMVIKDIIIGLEKSLGKKAIPIEDIIVEATNKNLTEDDVDEAINKLKREGEVFEPRKNVLSRV